MKEKTLKSKIKEMEDKQRAESQQAVAPSNDPMGFDHWYILTSKRLSLRPHMKEIVWADFNARGLKKVESAIEYDKGLALFGL